MDGDTGYSFGRIIFWTGQRYDDAEPLPSGNLNLLTPPWPPTVRFSRCDYGNVCARMSTLRRRLVGDSSSDPSRDSSPSNGEPIIAVPAGKLEKLKQKKGKRKSWLLFGLGGVFGVFVAAFFAQKNEVINFEGLMDFNLDSLIDVVPAGIIKDAKEITV